jgi:hypothetical protein
LFGSSKKEIVFMANLEPIIFAVHEKKEHRDRGFYDEPMRIVMADHVNRRFIFAFANSGVCESSVSFGDETKIRETANNSLKRYSIYDGMLNEKEVKEIADALVILGKLFLKYSQTPT